MTILKLAILIAIISGVVLGAPKNGKTSLLLSTLSDVSKVEVNAAAAPKSALEKEDGEKLQTSDSFGLGYYVPYTAPVVNPYYSLYNYPLYYPGFYHSYSHHGFNGYGYGGFGYNVGVYH